MRDSRDAPWLAGICVLCIAACSDLFTPEPRARPPEIAALRIDERSRLSDGGVLYVDAVPIDTAYRLRRGSVPIEVTTSAGDSEAPGLSAERCPPRDRGFHFLCFDFTVVMQTGHNVSEIAPRIRSAGGRVGAFLSGRSALITFFDPGRIARFSHEVSNWPGVGFTSPDDIFCFQGVPCVGLSNLEIPIPIDSGPPARNDGRIQARAGDTISVRYRQPSGASLEVRVVAP